MKTKIRHGQKYHSKTIQNAQFTHCYMSNRPDRAHMKHVIYAYDLLGNINVKLHHGRRSTRSHLMKWTTFSPSLVRKGMVPWIAGCPLITETKMTLESSLTTCKVPWMIRYLAMLVSELEDIKKRTDWCAHGSWICQLAHHALIGEGSDAALEFEVKCRLIHAVLDDDIELLKVMVIVSHDKGVLHLLGDQPYILCNCVWSCCDVCQQNHQCIPNVPSTLKAPTAPILIVSELYLPAPTWTW